MKRQSVFLHPLLIALLVVLSILPPGVQAASGSWVGSASSVRLFTPGRLVQSAPIAPSSSLSPSARIHSISWRFAPPPGQPSLEAWLCQGERCFSLPTARGTSQALAGSNPNQPLFFVFRLPQDARASKPVPVQGLQVIVNYRSIPPDFPRGVLN
nr:flagellar protein FlhE [uncultured Halomonas sp.]